MFKKYLIFIVCFLLTKHRVYQTMVSDSLQGPRKLDIFHILTFDQVTWKSLDKMSHFVPYVSKSL